MAEQCIINIVFKVATNMTVTAVAGMLADTDKVIRAVAQKIIVDIQ